MNVSWTLVLLIWALGTAWRCQQLSLFFQQETYLNRRFLRAIWQKRIFPWRALLFTVLAIFLTESATLHVLAAGVAVVPIPRKGPAKTPLRWTPRLWRLLLLAGCWLVVLIGIYGWQFHPGDVQHTIFGFILYSAAPLWLVVTNGIAAPIEAAIRRRYRQQAATILKEQQPTVIGITGSWGKTSTKHLLAELLSGRRRVYATPKSYNTLMGVTLAINRDLRNDYSIDTFIVEMGAYRRGEIAEICQLTRPSIAILIDIGPQHLERFGSLAATQKAKFELVEALPDDGLAVYNWDSAIVREGFAHRDHPQRRIAISRDEDAPPPVRLVAI